MEKASLPSKMPAVNARPGPRQTPLLSVIIPVYNEEQTVREVIERVLRVELPVEREVIVVDDGSTDGTPQVLRDLAGRITHHFVSQSNYGKGTAVRVGLSLADGDIILIQDADLELDPNEYHRLLAPILDAEASVVYGSRFLQPVSGVRFSRRLANRLLTGFTNLLYGTRLTDMETAYKVFTADVVRKLDLRSAGFELEPEITAQIARAGFHIREVPITYRPRSAAEGKKIRWTDGLKALYWLARCRLRR
jgi:glycosyltransferase involved in cell wall biosynthesis